MNCTETPHPFYRYGSLFCSITMVPVGAFGIAGNLVAACIFGKQRRRCSSPTSSPSPLLSTVKSRSPINILLMALTFIDTCLLTLATPLFSTIAMYNYSPEGNGYLLRGIAYMTIYVYPVCMIMQTASVYTILVISLERYAAVVHPLANREHGNVRKTKMTLLIVLLGSVVYNGCRFGEYRMNEFSNSTLPLLREDVAYVQVYMNWSYFILVFALPFSVLSVVNSLIAKTIFKARRQRQIMLLSQRNLREHRTALMMASVVVAYILCNGVALVLNAWEAAGGLADSDLFKFLSDFNNLLIQTHSSLTFVVYYRFSGYFRGYVRERCRLLCGGSSKLEIRGGKWESANYVIRSRSTSLLSAVRKYSSDVATRYRSWSQVGQPLNMERGRPLQMIVQERMALGVKRRAFAIAKQGSSMESQLDPFYV